jgi:hypothetical protein
MSGDADDRIAELEARIDDLEAEVEKRNRDFAMIATQLDLEEVPAQPCPACDAPALEKRSGFSWSKAVCTECGDEWYLSR